MLLEPRRSLLRRLCAWGFALPALAAALVFNHEYHRLLQEWLHVIPIDYIFVQDRSHFAGWLICICVQPALIEELFFRYLAFGSLRAVMGGHAVVWVTAVMFASRHIGVVLSLPVLFVWGCCSVIPDSPAEACSYRLSCTFFTICA